MSFSEYEGSCQSTHCSFPNSDDHAFNVAEEGGDGGTLQSPMDLASRWWLITMQGGGLGDRAQLFLLDYLKSDHVYHLFFLY